MTQPTTPTTAEEAAGRFRCAPLACEMSGAACAARARQVAKGDGWRSANAPAPNVVMSPCNGCAAGAARAALLPVTEPRKGTPTASRFVVAPNTMDQPRPRFAK